MQKNQRKRRISSSSSTHQKKSQTHTHPETREIWRKKTKRDKSRWYTCSPSPPCMPPRSPRSPKLMLQDTVVRPKPLKLSPIENSLTGYAAQELKKPDGNAKTGNKNTRTTLPAERNHTRAHTEKRCSTQRAGGTRETKTPFISSRQNPLDSISIQAISTYHPSVRDYNRWLEFPF